MPHVHLFISTVSDEFRSYRDLLRRKVTRPNVHVAVQEDFITAGGETLEKLDDYLRHCDAVVHLVGDMTGGTAAPAGVAAIRARYPDLPDRLPPLREALEAGVPGFSYTQWEAYLALYHRKQLLIFVPEPGASRGPKHVEDDSQRAAQAAHLQRLRALKRYPAEERFTDPNALAVEVLRSSIHDLLPPLHQPVFLPYPSLGTLFKGRAGFLQELRTSLERAADGHATAIVNAVHGLGGIGKTRLAVEYAWQHHHHYSALLFVTADSPAELHRNLAGLCGSLVLNLPEQEATEEAARVAAALRWLQAHPGWFLILDNVDTEEAAAAEELVGRLSGGHVVITSRLTRWSAGVQRLDLAVLDVPAAAAFLLERTAADRRRLPDSGDEQAAAQLAEALDGLALALEQAAAYIIARRISLAEYLQRWQAHVPTVQDWHNERLMQYPRSVAVTWQTTMDRLGPGETALLRLLSWMAPEPLPMFVLEGAKAEALWREAVTLTGAEPEGELADALARLADYSMVNWDATAETVTVHRVVQEIVRTRLPLAQQPEWLALGLRLLNAALPGNPTDVRTWPRWNPLRPHVSAAALAGAAHGIASPTSTLLNELGLLLKTKALHQEAEPLYRRALEIDERSYGPDHPEVATDLNNLAQLLQDTNRLTEAEPLMRRALEIDEHSYGTDHPNVAIHLNNLARLLQDTNRLAEAEPLMRRVVQIFETGLGADHPNVAVALK